MLEYPISIEMKGQPPEIVAVCREFEVEAGNHGVAVSVTLDAHEPTGRLDQINAPLSYSLLFSHCSMGPN